MSLSVEELVRVLRKHKVHWDGTRWCCKCAGYTSNLDSYECHVAEALKAALDREEGRT